MITIGKNKWPDYVKKAIGNKKSIEIKEHKGRYYAYKYKSIWDSENKIPKRKSNYIGVVNDKGLKAPYESTLHGIYEYGNVMFVYEILEKNGIVDSLKKIFPDDWKTILSFAMNRLIDPRSIKSMQSWYEKTYLIKFFGNDFYPKKISNVLERVGMGWGSQRDFLQKLKRDGEKVVYDGSVIFSSSKDNPILEVGYNKDSLLIPKANIVMAFSHSRFLPIFFRVVPGCIHEITTIDILLEELGEDIILVLDKGFISKKSLKKMNEKSKFVLPLKRDSRMIDYDKKLNDYFMYKKHPIKYCYYKKDKFYVYIYQDIRVKYDEERNYFDRLSKGKRARWNEKYAAKFAIVSNIKSTPQEIYEIWKTRNGVEMAFDVLQNFLETDRPYVHKEEIFKGYLFCSFIGLIAYYHILKMLKDAKINYKVSVSDALLELSKIYKVEINGKELISERVKKARKILRKLKMINLITNSGRS